MFVERPWSWYLREMSYDGTYSDPLTLQVAADMLCIVISVRSSLGPGAAVKILPQNIEAPLGHIFLGHFTKNQEIHYVSIHPLAGSHSHDVKSMMEIAAENAAPNGIFNDMEELVWEDGEIR